MAGSALAAPAELPVVRPGGVVRWQGPSLLECRRGATSWQPLDGACWYAIDLEATGEVVLVRRSTGGVASRRVRIGHYPYPIERLEVAPEYVTPPPESLARIARENEEVAAIFRLSTPRRFSLPLAAPLKAMPVSARFGVRRVFNREARSPHGGADFAAAEGTVILAPADGRVATAAEHYFSGRAVYLDHGDGLISMSFHLSEFLVQSGDEVKRGQPIGKVGATGRVTGPHLHFGLRWHGARVDPEILLRGGRGVVEIR